MEHVHSCLHKETFLVGVGGIHHFTNEVMKHNTIAATPQILAKALAHVDTTFVVMPLFELVEAILGFEKSSSDLELQEMLRGLKKTDLSQFCKKYRLKSSGNKPELIGRLLEKWKDSSASADEESMGAITSLGRTQAMFEQATNWSKTLRGLSDFTFMDLYTYLVLLRN